MYDTVIEVSTIDGITVASIANEVDDANSEIVWRYLDEAAMTQTIFVLSLEKCRHIDSSALRPIVALASRLGDGFFVVVPLEADIRRIFDSTAMYTHMNLCATLAEALGKATKGLTVV